eukprot:5677484-Amphidinium_carterae.2
MRHVIMRCEALRASDTVHSALLASWSVPPALKVIAERQRVTDWPCAHEGQRKLGARIAARSTQAVTQQQRGARSGMALGAAVNARGAAATERGRQPTSAFEGSSIDFK